MNKIKQLQKQIARKEAIIKVVEDYIKNYNEEHIELINIQPIFDKAKIKFWKSLMKVRRKWWIYNQSWQAYSHEKKIWEEEFKELPKILRIILKPYDWLATYDYNDSIEYFKNKMNRKDKELDKLLEIQKSIGYPYETENYDLCYTLFKKEHTYFLVTEGEGKYLESEVQPNE